MPRDELKAKLRAKLRGMKMSRQTKAGLDNHMTKLEDQLAEAKTSSEKKKINDTISLINKIEEDREKSINDDHPEYPDFSGYGGSLEHND